MNNFIEPFDNEQIKLWQLHAKTILWRLSLERGRLFTTPNVIQSLVDGNVLDEEEIQPALQSLIKNSTKMSSDDARKLAHEIMQILRNDLIEVAKPILSKNSSWDSLSEKEKDEISEKHFRISVGSYPESFREQLSLHLIEGN